MKIKILQGLPASGKTTWAKEFTRKHPDWIRVNRDDIRNMRGEYWIPKQENLITEIEVSAVRAALSGGYNVILDATNLNPKYLKQWKEIAKEFDAKIEYKKFDVDVDECIKRDLSRANSVGRDVIMGMYEKYFKKEEQEIYMQNENLPKAIIVDVDGTLAIMGDRGPYDWDKVGEDGVNQRICELVNFYSEHGYSVIICTGRDGVCENQTREWLGNYVSFDELYIRPEGNTEKDSVIKERMFDEISQKYNVGLVIDDRDQVVRMWRKKGLVCLQVADGNF